MLSRQIHPAVLVGAFLAPMVALHLTHVVNSSAEPMTAFAEEPHQPVVGANRKSVTEQQAEAMAHAAALRTDHRIEDPFYYPPVAAEENTVAQPVPSVPATTPTSAAAPALSLTSVLRGGDGRMYAVLNGRLYTVGHEVAPGWTLTAVNAAARTATVEHASGATHAFQF